MPKKKHKIDLWRPTSSLSFFGYFGNFRNAAQKHVQIWIKIKRLKSSINNVQKRNMNLICGDRPQVVAWNLKCNNLMMAQPNFNNLLSANNDWKYHSTFQRIGIKVFEAKFAICKFLLFGRSTNPEESCKVQFEGNLEPISRVYKGIAAFSHSNIASNHIVPALHKKIMRSAIHQKGDVQEIILSSKFVFHNFRSPKLNPNLVEMVGC